MVDSTVHPPPLPLTEHVPSLRVRLPPLSTGIGGGDFLGHDLATWPAHSKMLCSPVAQAQGAHDIARGSLGGQHP